MIAQVNRSPGAGSTDQTLRKAGGVAALVAALLTLSEVVLFAFYPQPGTVSDWFALFQSNQFLGLLDFWALEVLMYVASILVFLALYAELSETNKGLTAIATVLALLGIAVFFATNNPVSMLALSHQHAVATTEIERSTLLAAGQALLAGTGQRAVGGFNMGLFLVSVAGLIVSAVMLQSKSFRKSTAYFGMLANGFSLADYLRQALTSSPIAALVVVLPTALFLIIWYTATGRRLYQLARPGR